MSSEKTTRVVEDSSASVRYRVDIWLETGSVIQMYSKWQPSHFSVVNDLREDLIADAHREMANLKKKYGLGFVACQVFREERRTTHVTETQLNQRFHAALGSIDHG